MPKHEMNCPQTNEYFGMSINKGENPFDSSIYPLRSNGALILIVDGLSKITSRCEEANKVCPDDCPIRRTFRAANRDLWRRQEEVIDESFANEIERLRSFFADLDEGLENHNSQ